VAKNPSTEDRRQILEAQLAAFEAAGEAFNIEPCITELLAVMHDDESALRRSLELRRFAARMDCGTTTVSDESLVRQFMVTAGDEESLLRSATFNLLVAENTGSNGLALEALAVIERVGRSTTTGMIAFMWYHLVFGSLHEAGEMAVALQAAVATQVSSRLRYRAEVYAAVALFRLGEVERAAAGFQRTYETASEIGLQSGRILTCTQFAFLYWCLGDEKRFENWYQRTAQIIDRLPGPTQTAPHYSNGILRALVAGRASDAQELLTQAQLRIPHISQGRRGQLLMAYQLRIDLASGGQPSNEQIDRLLMPYRATKGFSEEDVIVDTLIGALRSRSRDVEAESLRTQFLGEWRRDRYPIPPHLINLRPAAG